MLYTFLHSQAEEDAKAKDRELNEALERMQQYEKVGTFTPGQLQSFLIVEDKKNLAFSTCTDIVHN